MSRTGWPGEIRAGKRVSSLGAVGVADGEGRAGDGGGVEEDEAGAVDGGVGEGGQGRGSRVDGGRGRRGVGGDGEVAVDGWRPRCGSGGRGGRWWRWRRVAAAVSVTGRVRQSASRIGQSIWRTTSTPAKVRRSVPSWTSRRRGPRAWVPSTVAARSHTVLPFRWSHYTSWPRGHNRLSGRRGRWDWR